jgi:aldehyde dehydrogenase (NAD+)
MPRLPITKTPKPYVGGAFIRSESGRVFPVQDAAGRFFAHIPLCTRKDLRNAVEAAAKAGPGWAKRTAYNRGQILYRLGEMLEARRAEMIDSLVRFGAKKAVATKDVEVSTDRLVYYAGWADKYEQVLGNVNPVAQPYFNFTVTEPMGIVGVLAPDAPPLLGLISLIAPAIVSGNTVVALASEKTPYPAILLGEMLATSDLPGGVVNLLTGRPRRTRAGVCDPRPPARDQRRRHGGGAQDASARRGGKRRTRSGSPPPTPNWFSDAAQHVYAIRDLLEFKTTWHPIGA